MHVADRESDIYELYCLTQELGAHFLVRMCVDRLAGDGGHSDLFLDLVQFPDTLQRFLGDGRRAVGSDLVKSSAQVRPACVRLSPGKENGM